MYEFSDATAAYNKNVDIPIKITNGLKIRGEGSPGGGVYNKSITLAEYNASNSSSPITVYSQGNQYLKIYKVNDNTLHMNSSFAQLSFFYDL